MRLFCLRKLCSCLVGSDLSIGFEYLYLYVSTESNLVLVFEYLYVTEVLLQVILLDEVECTS